MTPLQKYKTKPKSKPTKTTIMNRDQFTNNIFILQIYFILQAILQQNPQHPK